MIVDEDALRSLSVIDPSKGNKKSSRLTLYKMLSKTHSKIGADTLNNYIFRPLNNIEKIKKRHDSVETILGLLEISNQDNEIGLIANSLKNLGNVYHIVSQMKLGNLKPSIWKQLKNYLVNSTKISQYISGSDRLKHADVFQRFTNIFVSTSAVELLTSLETYLDFVTDPKTVSIQKGVHSELDKYRETYEELESILQSVSTEISQIINQDVNIAYIPQLGYLVIVDVQANVTDIEEEWNELFRTSTTIYYKNKRMEAMDDYFGDIYSLIRDAEVEVLYALKDKVLMQQEMMVASYESLGEIDVLITFAKLSHSYCFTKPEMVVEPIFQVKDCRHPLFLDDHISNDIEITKEKVMVLTGPNYSGKSSLLVQVGLITFLSHIGCFVPAIGKIGITDRILTRINTRESMTKLQSTFMADAQQMSRCLTRSTPNSLILIDEFGKGTDVYDGPALLASIIKYLSNMGQSSARTIVVTHFIEIFNDNLITFPNPIKLSHMQFLVNESENKEIAYLYKIGSGISTESFGIYCAKRCGIQEDIITRATQIIQMVKENVDLTDMISETSVREKEILAKAEKVVKTVLKLDLDST
ncbi:hypothetical protein CANARDRAFT_179331, partial [[Candida] arabinofermentans NRRL YB-2248]